MQCLTELTPRVAINICHFMMLLLHVSVFIDHLQRDHLQLNTFIVHAGQYVLEYIYICTYIENFDIIHEHILDSIYIYIYTYTHTHTHTHILDSIYIFTYMCTYWTAIIYTVYIGIYIYTYSHIHAHLGQHLYIYMYICTYWTTSNINIFICK
jgi:hypothetical protein